MSNNGRAAVTSVITGGTIFVALVLARRYILRALLGYRGWMYESRTKSWKTLGWCAGLRLLTGSKPLLYSFQRSLPRLPGTHITSLSLLSLSFQTSLPRLPGMLLNGDGCDRMALRWPVTAMVIGLHVAHGIPKYSNMKEEGAAAGNRLTSSLRMRLLPFLPTVPSLQETTERYIETIEHILPAEEVEKQKRHAESFLKNEGPKLQRYLIFKSWISDNYVCAFLFTI